jgi:uncharacterized delta-60 repeat protein
MFNLDKSKSRFIHFIQTGLLVAAAIIPLSLFSKGGIINASTVPSNPDFRDGAFDSNFSPVLSLATNNGTTNLAVPLPDGKILVGGYFRVAGGLIRTQLARLNSDGTFDNSFNVTIISTNTSSSLPTIHAILALPDGKILIGGSFNIVNTTTRNNLARLNADGSLDATFDIGSGFSAAVKAITLQPDGKLLVGGNFNSFNGVTRTCLTRLNPDGSLDTSLNTTISSGFADKMNSVVLQPDGKIFIQGTFNTVNGVLRRGLAKLNSDGTLDASFVEPGNYSLYNFMYAFAVRPDGRLYIGGFFEIRVNNQLVCQNLCRLNTDGTLDTSYFVSFGTNSSVRAMYLQPDGKLMIHGSFTTVNGVNRNGTTRLLDNGSIDATFNQTFNINYAASQSGPGSISSFAPLPDGGYLLPGSFTRINGSEVENLAKIDANGNADPNFAPPFAGVGLTYTSMRQPDGKLLVGGNFNRANGTPRNRVARFNADGSLDTSFNADVSNSQPGTSGFDNVNKFVVQPDGKILIGGAFALVNGEVHNFLGRLNADGSVESAFNPVIVYQGSGGGIINNIWLQPDGKIIIIGAFQTVNGVARYRIARLNSDGSLDTGFDVPMDSAYNSYLLSIVAQPDGKIILGGDLKFSGDSTIYGLARLNSNGSIDSSFHLPAQSATPSFVRSLALYDDGKILAGGTRSFDARPMLVRFNPDGSADASFSPGAIGSGSSNDAINSITLQPFGKILIGGSFSGVAGVARPNIARLIENGKLDYSFRALQTGAGISALNQTAAGDLIITGAFSQIENKEVTGIARLRNGFVTRTSFFDFDGDEKTDISIFRPTAGEWWYSKSSDGQVLAARFGLSIDKPVPGDFTGDGKTDIAFWRPQSGEWFVLRSENSTFLSFPFGQTGDIPVVGDFDSDGRADPGVFRPSTGDWFVLKSSGGVIILTFGSTGDLPVPADFDGDGKADIAIFRPSDGSWWYLQSSNSQFKVYRFGVGTDKPVPGDYTGDGKADIAVFRPSTGEWYFQRSEDNSYFSVPFGADGDIAAPGDYDGDGKFDTAVFRPSTANWFVQRSTAGILITTFGTSGDRPIPNVFVP